MSDTTGWRVHPDGRHYKDIGDFQFVIHRRKKCWAIYVNQFYIGIRGGLRECQQLAHATARLWAGEK